MRQIKVHMFFFSLRNLHVCEAQNSSLLFHINNFVANLDLYKLIPVFSSFFNVGRVSLIKFWRKNSTHRGSIY